MGETVKFQETVFIQKLNEFFLDEKENIKYKNHKEKFEIIKNYYETLLEKKIDIERIKYLQKNYINNEIDFQNMREEKRKIIKNRIKKLEEFLGNEI